MKKLTILSFFKQLTYYRNNILLSPLNPQLNKLNLKQIKCYEQVESTDCRLFGVGYVVDILNGYNVYDLIYDQNKMREHFNCLFRITKIDRTSTLRKKKYRKSGNIKRNIFTMEQAPTFSQIKIKITQNLTSKIKFPNRLKLMALTHRRKT